jgi:3-carboxy-cis,cis-muconate cycloisomerase
VSEGGLFDAVLARGGVRDAVSDRAWLQAMLDVEAALARAEAAAGVIAVEHAEAIAAACEAERYDVAALGAQAAAVGNPAAPLVAALREQIGAPAADDVHRGATSQDIVDSAAMLVARRALEPLLDDLGAAADAVARLAADHRDTMMAGRTLLQHAVPITFGLKAAGWLVALDESAERLHAVRDTRLAVQLGGAAGTLAALGDAGPEVLAAFAAELGLAEPVVPWHTARTRVVELAGALGEACGVAAKVAGDVVLLAQTEVAEVSEGGGGRGGSSTMPHKRNPVAAIAARAAARQAPGLVATLLVAMDHEHERAAGAWHAEWAPLRELLRTTGSAAAWLRDSLEHLEVDRQRMRENLDSTGGAPMAERVAGALAPALGRDAADTLVREALANGRLVQAAREHLAAEEVERLLDPAGYLGAAHVFIDRALSGHAARGADTASDRREPLA